MGEAPTGSGKTLAYLIPVVELLWREQWSVDDGLGAMIIVPTRELSLQIFDVLRAFNEHEFSAIAVFGGKFVDQERSRIRKMNILIGTPGRLRQHLEETAELFVEELRVLVLDEVDKLIEFGFAQTLKEIVESLPPKSQRQTLMFSATLSSEVRILMREFSRSENDQCIHVSSLDERTKDKGSINVTPQTLRHTYCIVELEDKLSILYSFLSRNFKSKTLVFVSSIKQSRFIYETFKQIKTGARIIEMHGGQDQNKRLQVFDEFNRRNRAITLIATDVVGRGVDFPDVDWVIQLDCPPDVDTYIHRVGRTARGLSEKGNGCIFLLPSEVKFVSRIKEKQIDIKQVKAKVNAKTDITPKLASLNAKNHDIKHLATKFFSSYLRSMSLMKDKDVFKLDALKGKLEKFAKSLGLPSVPSLDKLVQPESNFTQGSSNADEFVLGGVTAETNTKKLKNMTKLERLKEKIRLKKLAKARGEGVDEDNILDEEETDKKSSHQKRIDRVKELRLKAKKFTSEDNDDEVFQITVIDTEKPKAVDPVSEQLALHRAISKGKIVIKADGTAKLKGAAKLVSKTHLFFGDDDEIHDVNTFEGLVASLNAEAHDSSSGEEDSSKSVNRREKHLEKVKKALEATKQEDKKRARERRVLSKQELKSKKKARVEKPDDVQSGALLATSDQGEEEVSVKALEEEALRILNTKNRNK
eukprot:Gregarina_sp_Poly_1__3113@NODE_1877_length_3152_cov_86_092382_g1218_i0_p1_GENE_NODE_1877_length_3152_cov_86_092382_g1218_i0NODE_1877_length_3152_cov_86_092382_g1218_i0_p1_ORF_typecomplete_len814_score141_18DEAD/PF00270_29/1e42DEAD/PF00270_29/2_9e02Helicase_C/PF00271_31/1_4e04Helicase_C/PF00271_31/8_5e03Helicase_C/PF00271_31/5_2e26ResIII/PF04851_15/1_1e13ResIII/PF04851_15/3e02DUF4217/PF13959_6/9_5e11ERCC3_RAD25_C/PF16203_5/3_5e09AAA_19/PF13245_6/0_33_NODE_1877_length_3152_cov_86_092382_g1218_i034